MNIKRNSFILCVLVFAACEKKEKGNYKVNEIKQVFKKNIIDENWQMTIQDKTKEQLYVPMKWKKIDTDHFDAYLIARNRIFFMDVVKLDSLKKNEFEKELLSGMKTYRLKNNKIIKLRFNNSNSVQYHFEIINPENQYLGITNIFLNKEEVHRFSIESNKGLDEKYIDTLDIITNTYKKNNLQLFVPFSNGIKDVEYLSP